MNWTMYFAFSAGILALAIVSAVSLARVSNQKRRVLNSVNVLVVGVFLSSVVMFLPIYGEVFSAETCGVVKQVLLSFHNAIRLFIVDGEFSIVSDHLAGVDGWIAPVYSVYAAILFVTAPFLTFGFVLSFFKNMSAYRRYFLGFFRDAYVFSALNDKSYALAKSLKKNHAKCVIIFTNVFETNDETSYEIIERARRIGAICFRKDIQTINFKVHSRKASLTFFAIGEEEIENVDSALKLIDAYRERDNSNLYVFANRTESDLLLTSSNKGVIKVRRVNDIRSLVNRILYEEGGRIFASASNIEQSEKRRISAVIIGLGQYGTMMMKSLPWFCQMDGYEVVIHAFDHDENAEDRFSVQCPELMDSRYNGTRIDGEAWYDIKIHSGVNIDSTAFLREVSKIPQPTYVFVALGNDEQNIQSAVSLRSLFERLHWHPIIQTVVYSTAEKEALRDADNFKGQKYDIEFIGDLDTFYSEEVIINSELEAEALKRHLRWGTKEEFWKYEYNYRSSVASAIHKKMKLFCKMPGIEKEPDERTDEELWALRRLEHRRWNAYMRSEGYCYAPERNDLAKTHHCLVTFDKLPEKEQEKDDD